MNSSSKPTLIWDTSYDALSPAQRLNYFSERQHIHFFPVLDREMTEEAFVDDVLDNRFNFNGEVFLLTDPIDWLCNPSPDIEWHILLHKFYYAPGLGKAWVETQDRRYLEKWVELITSWMEQTPIDFIAPDVTGRRIQNWIYSWYYFVASNRTERIDPQFHDRFLDSIQKQVNYLCTHLAPARNHRTIALYSIFLASIVFPETTDAKHWQDFSLREIYQNVLQDLLPDGVQCELSTDYHHLVLKNYLAIRLLAKLNQITIQPEFDERLNRALDFAMFAHKPDGEVPSFSDGDVRSFEDCLLQGASLYQREDLLFVGTRGQQGIAPSQRNAGFDVSGYYILRSGWGQENTSYQDERYLMIDCGPLGEGNHGHFDALSFEAAAFGRSLIVDPARYTYHEAKEVNWRVKFRSTESHNTVLVDGKNQTRYLAGLKRYKIKGPQPVTQLHAFQTQRRVDYFHGSTRSSEYDALHHRQIAFIQGEYWIIVDSLYSASWHEYEQLFHLSTHAFQSVQTIQDENCCQVITPNLVIATPANQNHQLIVETGYVSRRYGEKKEAPVLRFRKRAKNTRFVSVLYPFKDGNPDIYVSIVEMNAGNHFEVNCLVYQKSGLGFADSCQFPKPELVTGEHFSWDRKRIHSGDRI
ncbi:MAG TPA: alginate lyase family protein [Nitrosomonas sp.]|nr:alginate lyase family protein [Nitrosomonas sp.]